MTGTSTSGTTATTMAASLALVTTSRMRAPVSIKRLRSHCDSAEPITVCRIEVSATSRDRISPVRAVSKKAGDSVSMRS